MNKSDVVKAFLPVLQMTRAGEGITELGYQKDKYDYETVTVEYKSGDKLIVDVSCDSSATMLKEIIDAVA